MNFRKNGFKIFAVLLIFSLLIVGCTPARRPITDQAPGRTGTGGTGTGTGTDGTGTGTGGTGGTTGMGTNDTNNGIIRTPGTTNDIARNTAPVDDNNANTPGDTMGGSRGQEGDIAGRTNEGTDRTSDLITPGTPGTNGTTGIGNGDANNTMETRIIREAERVNGVKNAVVLVNNDVAYVGVDVGTTIADEDADYVRDEVINRIHTAIPTIERVYVSSNPDTLGRLRGFGNDIRGGRPITGFIDQVETMFRRTIPRT
ncbi:MAG: hypothetical protein K0R93_458 [Anaerosolibacter sp.]|jgi:YhcN/YlaJ family sporulation lipoprotein|uniref:YhcN/YlaJ family sporulation lipoprotein n=1 Tax=Anaerosolibacter sp. TaxID=1872527 RepID=UPI0026175B38|nr:YhcN/YlaJ family sporulation lipoprotein [Anaerosolibacter sp.]MDF2545560.1 hypothetical protein [Anaerosolibacter sp.]